MDNKEKKNVWNIKKNYFFVFFSRWFNFQVVCSGRDKKFLTDKTVWILISKSELAQNTMSMTMGALNSCRGG